MERVICQEQLVAYAAASGDHNPLHLDPGFAASTQFGGIIAHGMLTLAFVYQMLSDTFGSHWIQTGRLKVRFVGPAHLGDTVTTWGQVIRDEPLDDGRWVESSVGLRNQNGDELIAGTAVVKIQGKDRTHTTSSAHSS